MSDIFKFAIALAVIFFILGFLFSFLFKLGLITLGLLAILYLYKKIFG